MGKKRPVAEDKSRTRGKPKVQALVTGTRLRRSHKICSKPVKRCKGRAVKKKQPRVNKKNLSKKLLKEAAKISASEEKKQTLQELGKQNAKISSKSNNGKKSHTDSRKKHAQSREVNGDLKYHPRQLRDLDASGAPFKCVQFDSQASTSLDNVINADQLLEIDDMKDYLTLKQMPSSKKAKVSWKLKGGISHVNETVSDEKVATGHVDIMKSISASPEKAPLSRRKLNRKHEKFVKPEVVLETFSSGSSAGLKVESTSRAPMSGNSNSESEGESRSNKKFKLIHGLQNVPQHVGGAKDFDKNPGVPSEVVFTGSENKIHGDAHLHEIHFEQHQESHPRACGGVEEEVCDSGTLDEVPSVLLNMQESASSSVPELNLTVHSTMQYSVNSGILSNMASHDWDQDSSVRVRVRRRTGSERFVSNGHQNTNYGQSSLMSCRRLPSVGDAGSGCEGSPSRESRLSTSVSLEEAISSKEVVKNQSSGRKSKKTNVEILKQTFPPDQLEKDGSVVSVTNPSRIRKENLSSSMKNCSIMISPILSKVKKQHVNVERCKVTRTSKRVLRSKLPLTEDVQKKRPTVPDKNVEHEKLKNFQEEPLQMNSKVQTYRPYESSIYQGDELDSLEGVVVKNDVLSNENLSSLHASSHPDLLSNCCVHQRKKQKFSSARDPQKFGEEHENTLNHCLLEMQCENSQIRKEKSANIETSGAEKHGASVGDFVTQTTFHHSEAVRSPCLSSKLTKVASVSINSSKVNPLTKTTIPAKVNVQNNTNDKIKDVTSVKGINTTTKACSPSLAAKSVTNDKCTAAKSKGKQSQSAATKQIKDVSSFRGDELFRPDVPKKVSSPRRVSFVRKQSSSVPSSNSIQKEISSQPTSDNMNRIHPARTDSSFGNVVTHIPSVSMDDKTTKYVDMLINYTNCNVKMEAGTNREKQTDVIKSGSSSKPNNSSAVGRNIINLTCSAHQIREESDCSGGEFTAADEYSKPSSSGQPGSSCDEPFLHHVSKNQKLGKHSVEVADKSYSLNNTFDEVLENATQCNSDNTTDSAFIELNNCPDGVLENTVSKKCQLDYCSAEKKSSLQSVSSHAEETTKSQDSTFAISHSSSPPSLPEALQCVTSKSSTTFKKPVVKFQALRTDQSESMKPPLVLPKHRTNAVNDTAVQPFHVQPNFSQTKRDLSDSFWISTSDRFNRRLDDDDDDDAISLFASSDIFGTEFGSQECKVTHLGPVKPPAFLRDSDDESEEEKEVIRVETKRPAFPCGESVDSLARSKASDGNDTVPSEPYLDFLFDGSDRNAGSVNSEVHGHSNDVLNVPIILCDKQPAQEIKPLKGATNLKLIKGGLSSGMPVQCKGGPRNQSGSFSEMPIQVGQNFRNKLECTGISVLGNQGTRNQMVTSPGSLVESKRIQRSQTGSSPGISVESKQSPKKKIVSPRISFEGQSPQSRSASLTEMSFQSTQSPRSRVGSYTESPVTVMQSPRSQTGSYTEIRGQEDMPGSIGRVEGMLSCTGQAASYTEVSVQGMPSHTGRAASYTEVPVQGMPSHTGRAASYTEVPVQGMPLHTGRAGSYSEIPTQDMLHPLSRAGSYSEIPVQGMPRCPSIGSFGVKPFERQYCTDFLMTGICSYRDCRDVHLVPDFSSTERTKIKNLMTEAHNKQFSYAFKAIVGRFLLQVDEEGRTLSVKRQFKWVYEEWEWMLSLLKDLGMDTSGALNEMISILCNRKDVGDITKRCIFELSACSEVVFETWPMVKMITNDYVGMACNVWILEKYIGACISKSPPCMEFCKTVLKLFELLKSQSDTFVSKVKPHLVQKFHNTLESVGLGNYLQKLVGGLQVISPIKSPINTASSSANSRFIPRITVYPRITAPESEVPTCKSSPPSVCHSNVNVPLAVESHHVANLKCDFGDLRNLVEAKKKQRLQPPVSTESNVTENKCIISDSLDDRLVARHLNTSRSSSMTQNSITDVHTKDCTAGSVDVTSVASTLPKQCSAELITPSYQSTPPGENAPKPFRPKLVRRNWSTPIGNPESSLQGDCTASSSCFTPRRPVLHRRLQEEPQLLPVPPRQQSLLLPVTPHPQLQQPKLLPQHPHPQLQLPVPSHPQLQSPLFKESFNCFTELPQLESQPYSQPTALSAYASKIEEKLCSDLDTVRECLIHGDYDTVANILNGRRATPRSSDIAREAYEVLKEEVNKMTSHYKNIVQAAVGVCNDDKMRGCLAVIGVSSMLHMSVKCQWDSAMTILNTMYQAGIDPYHVTVENEGQLCSQARCTLGCCEVCMNSGFSVKAANIMTDFRLLETDPSLWVLEYNAGDDKIRNIMCKHVFQALVDEDISAALEFFCKVYDCQKESGSPIDLKSGFNDMLVGLLDAGRHAEALGVYRQFMLDVGRVENGTVRALLAVAVDKGDLQYARKLWLCLRLTGTYFQQLGEVKSYIPVKSFWLKEEVYMTLLNYFERLAGKFKPPDAVYSADEGQFTVNVVIQNETFTYDENTPEMLKTHTLRMYAVDRVKNVLRYSFQPAIGFLSSRMDQSQTILQLNRNDVRQYVISVLQRGNN